MALAVTVIATAWPTREAAAFPFRGEHWFEVLIPIRIYLDSPEFAGGMEVNVSPPSGEFLLGGGFFLGERGIDLTFNLGYVLSSPAVTHFVVPAYLRVGIIDTGFGVAALTGMKAIYPDPWKFKLNTHVLGGAILHLGGQESFRTREELPLASPILEPAIGFATIQGDPGCACGTTTTYY